MPAVQPQKQREFAVEVVRQLRDHGFEAYWAGGCVRDQLLGRTPVDYDVATSAKPEEIRGVFPHRKTLAVGAAFGVMTVLGRAAGQIEVATFRQDLGYSDGRHPDQVKFSSPQEDAQRRDFTINGMFYDPLEEKVIDFVGGEVDLNNHVVRTIGDPRLRIEEDKLRMLRAVRFASVFDFHLDENTHAAICEMAPQVTVVSARSGLPTKCVARWCNQIECAQVQLFSSTGLLQAILPKVAALVEKYESNTAAQADISTPWRRTLAVFGALQNPTFPLAVAALLQEAPGADLAETIGQRWRLARAEIERMAWLVANKNSLADAAGQRWSQLQPLLVDAGAKELLEFYAAQAAVSLAERKDVEFCRAQMQRPIAELDPPPLLTGDDLIDLGIPRAGVCKVAEGGAHGAVGWGG